ncbi:MAG: hypothetical protein V4675_07495 [Verrucomicrobiota bacterium]
MALQTVAEGRFYPAFPDVSGQLLHQTKKREYLRITQNTGNPLIINTINKASGNPG